MRLVDSWFIGVMTSAGAGRHSGRVEAGAAESGGPHQQVPVPGLVWRIYINAMVVKI